MTWIIYFSSSFYSLACQCLLNQATTLRLVVRGRRQVHVSKTWLSCMPSSCIWMNLGCVYEVHAFRSEFFDASSSPEEILSPLQQDPERDQNPTYASDKNGRQHWLPSHKLYFSPFLSPLFFLARLLMYMVSLSFKPHPLNQVRDGTWRVAKKSVSVATCSLLSNITSTNRCKWSTWELDMTGSEVSLWSALCATCFSPPDEYSLSYSEGES